MRSDILELQQLTKLLGLPDYDDTLENALEPQSDSAYAWESGNEEARQEAEQKAADAISKCIYDAIVATADHVFGQHGLELLPSSKTWRFKVVPVSWCRRGQSWADALTLIRDTIRGVGMFDTGRTNREFCAYGPWTVREAVLVHLHHMKHRAEVYGEIRPGRFYQSELDDCFRRL